ncbi:MAG: hypothetical protein ACOX0A_10310 [Thermoguttaceae bacterium]|jgi:tetratricopeptide (TPR) repeat protein
MTYTIIQTLLDAMTSPILWSVALCCGALIIANAGLNDESEDYEDLEDDFQFTRADLEEYREFIETTNRLITEKTEELDAGADPKTTLPELVSLYLSRAARYHEEGEFEPAVDDYAAAFARYAEYVDLFDESLELLKIVAAGRLNYGILLNDAGELSDADEEYARAEQATQKLADFGDRDAKIDLVGTRLNRASIAFDLGDHTGSIESLDDVAEEFRKIIDDPETIGTEALFYLAKTCFTKASLLRSILDVNDLDSPDALEASAALKEAIDVYRRLIAGGETQYRRDLADALVLGVSSTPTRSKEELVAASDALAEACNAYHQVITYGEHDACVDLFDASLQRAKILMRLELFDDALALYTTVVESFKSFGDTDELPLVEGLATAYLNRAKLRKGSVKPNVLVADLTEAIRLQSAVARSLIKSLGGSDCDDCCCEHEHEHLSETARNFLMERWAFENFRNLMECYYERINARLEERDTVNAAADCLAAEDAARAYRSVLREGESFDEETLDAIRRVRRNL